MKEATEKKQVQYNPASHRADEFIHHGEILETLAYAEQNRSNAALIDQIIAKAEQRKGLTHREAAVLLDCDIPEKNGRMFGFAEQKMCIRDRVGGSRSLSRAGCAVSPVLGRAGTRGLYARAAPV